MALPKLSGSGMARSAAGAIGKSVRTGTKALGVMALSQMEPEVLTGIATAKMLGGKLKGKLKGKGAGGNSEADVAELKQSIEEIAPEINQTGIQSLTQQVEQVPPRTSEPIVQKIEELKEAKEAETNLEPVVEKLDELTPMLEKVDILTEQNEKDLFSVNLVLDSVDQGITSIESMFTMLMRGRSKEKSDKLEDDREASRKPSGVKSKLSVVSSTQSKSDGGVIMGTIMSLVSGGSMIPILGTILTAAGAALTAALPVLIPLVHTAGLGAAVWIFLESELADKIRNWLSGMFFDAEKEMKDLLARSKAFSDAMNKSMLERDAALSGIESGQTDRQITEKRQLETTLGEESVTEWSDEIAAAGPDQKNAAPGSISEAYRDAPDRGPDSKSNIMARQIEKKLIDKLINLVKTIKDPEQKRHGADLLREYLSKASIANKPLMAELERGHRMMDESPSLDNLPTAHPNGDPMVGYGYEVNDEKPNGQNVSTGNATRKWETGKNMIDSAREEIGRNQSTIESINEALSAAAMDASSLVPAGPPPQQVTPTTPPSGPTRSVIPTPPSTGQPVGNGTIQGSPVTSNTTNNNTTINTNPPDRELWQFGGTMLA